MNKPWGTIAVGTRMEKVVDSLFVERWGHLISKGLRKGDAWMVVRDRPAHTGANELVRRFLRSGQDTLLMLDSDADFEVDLLNRLRDFEPGWAFDALQAFHTRRGWPPEAIWFKQQGERLMQCAVTDETTEEVGMVGTHCALIRRQVFERIYQVYGEGIAMEDFQWFCYPRHQKMSDEATLSKEARKLGFRLGATTTVKVDHISRVSTGWQSHQEWLELSGTKARLEEFKRLAGQVARYTGEDVEQVMSKALEGVKNTLDAYTRDGTPAAGYLYELIGWNTSELYRQIVKPLETVQGARVLVIGAGLGSEAEILAEANHVDVYELPGTLREFCLSRLDGRVRMLNWDTLERALLDEFISKAPGYDLVVAIDVLEHIPPGEFGKTMTAVDMVMALGGLLYCHNNFSEATPFAYDNSQAFAEWLEKNNFVKEGEYAYRYSGKTARGADVSKP